MPRVFFYKMTDDTGFGPSVDDHTMTLACCKPGIRQHAVPDDVVIGFGDKHHGERLIYACKVRERLTGPDYYGNPANVNRRDCIYGVRDDLPYLRPGRGIKGHRTQDDLEHDVGAHFERGHVLRSPCQDFRYFGRTGTAVNQALYPILAQTVSASGCRPYRVDHGPALLEELEQLVESTFDDFHECVMGEPSDPWPVE